MKTNRILSGMLLCMLPTYVFADPISVTTAQELQNAFVNSTSETVIHIAADIDMTDFNWSPVSEFKGTLEGKYVTGDSPISEIRNKDGFVIMDDKNQSVSYGKHRIIGLNDYMFNTLTNAHISDIVFEGSSFTAHAGINGLIALYANGTEFSNIIFFRCGMKDGTILAGADNIGLAAGNATASKFGNISIIQSSVESVGDIVGGLVGKASGCNFLKCTTDIHSSVYGADKALEGDGKVGGLVGWATKDNSTPCHFKGCHNVAMVGAGVKADMLGGLVGYSEGSEFTICENDGVVANLSPDDWESVKAKVAGIIPSYWMTEGLIQTAGLAEEFLKHYLNLVESGWDFETQGWDWGMQVNAKEAFINFGPAFYLMVIELLWYIYQAQDPDEVGGICGNANGGSFSNCINSGYIRCLDAFGGGIVGYAKDVTVSDCLNTGNVMGDEQTGGIAGYISGSTATITRCVNSGYVYVRNNTPTSPIYGELANGAKSNKLNFTIDSQNTTQEQFGVTDITHADRQTLASGRIAKILNEASGMWGQKIGTTLYPMPLKNQPKADAENNAVNPNVDCWIEVSTLSELKTALTDPYSWIRLTSDITLGSEDYDLVSEQVPFRGRLDGYHGLIYHKFSGLTRYIDYEERVKTPKGIFNYAEGAVFENLTVDDVYFTGTCEVGSLVGDSKFCIYRNVRLGATDNSLVACTGEVVGGIVGISLGDTFENCSTEAGSRVESDGFSTSGNAIAGGIAGSATSSNFINCTNNSQITGDDDRVGGIAGEAFMCSFSKCVNNGTVRHLITSDALFAVDDELGGIAGYVQGSTIDQCINNGACTGGDAYIGGIAGYATGTQITYCLNTATIKGDEQTGAIAGYFERGNIQNCLTVGKVYVDNGTKQVNGMDELFGDRGDLTHWTNNYIKSSSYNAGSGGRALVTETQLAEGRVAYWLNESKDDANVIWRQTLQSDAYPVLDQTHDIVQKSNFTNIYIINNESDLRSFASRVNSTGDTEATGVLAADITLTGTWTPIGNGTHNYCGTFYGNNHKISNVQVPSVSENERLGFFGEIGPGAIICDLIIDGQIGNGTSSGKGGAGGIVGAASVSNNSSGTVQILRCGNMANISTNGINAAGIIGAVYSSDNLSLTVTDCWNTGNISSRSQSAYLCANTKKNATFTNCWNSGTLIMSEMSTLLYVRKSTGIDNQVLTLTNCWQLSTLAPHEGVSTFTAADLANGQLCYKLNGNKAIGTGLVWQQNIGTDGQPVFGDKGIYHARQMETNTFGTACLPFDVKSTSEIQFYSMSSSYNDELVFTPVNNNNVVVAGTPCLFARLSDIPTVEMNPITNTLTTGINGYELSDHSWEINGTYQETQKQGAYWYIAQDKIWHAVRQVTIPAYRAYFVSSVQGQQVAIRIGGTTKVIQPEEITVPAAVYDIYGRRYSDGTNLAPGLYIINGKKIIVQ